MRRVLRLFGGLLIASSWLLVATLAPASAQGYGPGQPDPCVFVLPFDADASLIANSRGEGICTAGIVFTDEPHGPRSMSVDVHRKLTAQDAIQQMMDMAHGRPPTGEYGGQAFEGSDSFHQFRIGFAVHNYVGVASSFDFDADRARAHAQQLYTAMAAQIGPPQAVASPSTVPTRSPAVSPSPTPSGSPGPLSVGLGCAADDQVVRCTVSVFGARPDADLAYEWRFDGSLRPETGSTMQVEWRREGVAEGTHSVGLSVRDVRNNLGPAGDVAVFALGASGATPTGDPVLAAAAAAMVTAALAGIAAAAGSGKGAPAPAAPGSSTEADALDTALELGDAETGLLPPMDDQAAWKRLTNWPPALDADFGRAWVYCGSAGSPEALLACLRGLARGGWELLPAKPAPVPSPAPAPPQLTPDDVGAAAIDLVGADAGNLPPINTPADVEKWKALAGWPDGPEAHQYFMNAIGNTPDMTPAQRLDYLRGEAARIRAAVTGQPPSPASPEPRPLDPTDVLDKDFEP